MASMAAHQDFPDKIWQVLFQRAGIRELYNQPRVPAVDPEAGSVERLALW